MTTTGLFELLKERLRCASLKLGTLRIGAPHLENLGTLFVHFQPQKFGTLLVLCTGRFNPCRVLGVSLAPEGQNLTTLGQ